MNGHLAKSHGIIVSCPSSLGLATYLDDYRAGDDTLRTKNKVIDSSFSWLHRRIDVALQSVFDKPMHYDGDRRTLPGFHIFMNSKIFEHNVAMIHNDLQYAGSAKFGKIVEQG